MRVSEHQEAEEKSEYPKGGTRIHHGGRQSCLDCRPGLTETEPSDVSHNRPRRKQVENSRQDAEFRIDCWKLEIGPTKSFGHFGRGITLLQREAPIEFGCCLT